MNRSLASVIAACITVLVGIFGSASAAHAATPMTTVSNMQTLEPAQTEEEGELRLPEVHTLTEPVEGVVPKPTLLIVKPLQARKAKKPVAIVDYVVLEKRKAAAAAKSEVERPRTVTSKRSTVTKTRAIAKKTTSKTTSYRASSGPHASYNWATPGQCTWGALQKWKNYTGWYLGGFTGNAQTWNTRAAAAGHSVGTTPRAHSVVVFEAGVAGASSVGHVAWVTSVSGSKVTFIEMNGMAGPYNYNTRTTTHQGGMSYIYAP